MIPPRLTRLLRYSPSRSSGFLQLHIEPQQQPPLHRTAFIASCSSFPSSHPEKHFRIPFLVTISHPCIRLLPCKRESPCCIRMTITPTPLRPTVRTGGGSVGQNLVRVGGDTFSFQMQ